MKASIIFIVIIFVGFVLNLGHTHPGRTDANGGHYERKTGEYHKHNQDRSKSKSEEPDNESEMYSIQNLYEKIESAINYPFAFKSDFSYEVMNIVSGDTVEIERHGKIATVKMMGVDTPTANHPNETIAIPGKRALAFTQNLLLGESVYLQFDSNQTDKSERLLAYLYRMPDGLFINLEVIRQGYGVINEEFPFMYSLEFKYYQVRASKIGKGIHPLLLQNADKANMSFQADVLPSVKPKATEGVKHKNEAYISLTDEVYHRLSCSRIVGRFIRIPLTAARKLYTPCKWCQPDKDKVVLSDPPKPVKQSQTKKDNSTKRVVETKPIDDGYITPADEITVNSTEPIKIKGTITNINYISDVIMFVLGDKGKGVIVIAPIKNKSYYKEGQFVKISGRYLTIDYLEKRHGLKIGIGNMSVILADETPIHVP